MSAYARGRDARLVVIMKAAESAECAAHADETKDSTLQNISHNARARESPFLLMCMH